jgi:hypothetical protein
VVGQFEAGPGAVDEEEEEKVQEWLLDVTAETGSPSDWAKLLTTDLVCAGLAVQL